jgi:hypothetical protein
MQRAVMHQFSLRTMPEPPDVADAIAIAACAARRHADIRALVPGSPVPERRTLRASRKPRSTR